MNVRTKRVYEPASDDDGVRILVDRLWPRGLKKEAVAADHWLREVAPSDELRRWFHHDPTRWDEFVERYHAELDDRPEALDELRELAKGADQVTLLYGARDAERNQAVVLADLLRARGKRRGR